VGDPGRYDLELFSAPDRVFEVWATLPLVDPSGVPVIASRDRPWWARVTRRDTGAVVLVGPYSWVHDEVFGRE
jgi:hypothetical protein